MSRGVYVQGVSVQEGICPGVTVRGVHVRGGYVLEPGMIYFVVDEIVTYSFLCSHQITLRNRKHKNQLRFAHI